MFNSFATKKITQFSFVRFCIVGGFVFCLDAAILYICIYGLNCSPKISRVISAICSITISWVLHRNYTFNPPKFNLLLEYGNYIICSLLSFVINLSVYIILIDKLLICWQYPILALIAATATSMNFSYFFMKKLIFLKKILK
jgi:putative flippase GtrA